MSTQIRLYLDAALSAGQQVELTTDQAHYINNVMRLAVGDGVTLFNEQFGEWAARIVDGRKKTLCARSC